MTKGRVLLTGLAACLLMTTLAGCGTTAPPPVKRLAPECRPDGGGPLVEDTQPGVSVSVPVQVKVVNGGTMEPVGGRWIYADMRHFEKGMFTGDASENLKSFPCAAAVVMSGLDGMVTMHLAAGQTFQIVHGVDPPTKALPMTLEVLPNVTVSAGMAPLTMPLYPQVANFTWHGTITGVDPGRFSETSVLTPVFNADPAREREFLRRMHNPQTAYVKGGTTGTFQNITLRWTNTQTWADLAVNIDIGTQRYDLRPADRPQTMNDGPQQEWLGLVELGHAELEGAMAKGIHVEVYDSGPIAAPTGLGFDVTVTARLFGPYEA